MLGISLKHIPKHIKFIINKGALYKYPAQFYITNVKCQILTDNNAN